MPIARRRGERVTAHPAVPVRALVVDDEPLARAGMRGLLADDPDVALVGECANGGEAIAAIRTHAPDLVLLDVQMPEVDGFAVVREIGVARMPVVVFVTAFDQYALRAFDAQALDYLLKPFSDERFHQALGRAKEQVRQRRLGALSGQLAALLGVAGSTPAAAATAPAGPAGPAPATRFEVRLGDRRLFVAVTDIDWIEASDYYVRLHAGGRSHLLRETLQELETRLDPRRFVRVHRSAMVAVDRVTELR
ncbi:MAG TPA: LytTR family DNA-binding domain-containing protein, partial [Gemmatirosa sp.]|nr:LytTR family DNA-binding domain-containing protein [Gemmatirosa sp.]